MAVLVEIVAAAAVLVEIAAAVLAAKVVQVETAAAALPMHQMLELRELITPQSLERLMQAKILLLPAARQLTLKLKKALPHHPPR